MNKQSIESLQGKRLLYSEGLDAFTSMFYHIGVQPIPDNYSPDTPLEDRFRRSRADIAAYSVLFADQGWPILRLPDKVKAKFVAVKNHHGNQFSDTVSMYRSLEQAKILSIYEDRHQPEDFENCFAQVLLQALSR